MKKIMFLFAVFFLYSNLLSLKEPEVIYILAELMVYMATTYYNRAELGIFTA